MKKIRIMKHSKGSYEYDKEKKLWELLEEEALFQIEIEEEKEKLIKALLSKEELLLLKNTISEVLEHSKEEPGIKMSNVPMPKKTAQKQFEEDYIQQRDSNEIEEEIVPTKDKRRIR